MLIDRVYNFIQKHDKTIVYVDGDSVKCADFSNKNSQTIIKNKKHKYQLIGIYNQQIRPNYLVDDLKAMGVY